MKEWIQITGHEFQVQQTTSPSKLSSKWKKPPSGCVKCNFDVAHREGNVPSGLGWIIRNHAGTFLKVVMVFLRVEQQFKKQNVLPYYGLYNVLLGFRISACHIRRRQPWRFAAHKFGRYQH